MDEGAPLSFQQINTLPRKSVKLSWSKQRLAGELSPSVKASIRWAGPRALVLEHAGGALALLIRSGGIQEVEKLPYNLSTRVHFANAYPSCSSTLAVLPDDVVLILVPTNASQRTDASTLITWSGIFMAPDAEGFVKHSQMAFDAYGKGVAALAAIIQ
jgi:hypothetical protein